MQTFCFVCYPCLCHTLAYYVSFQHAVSTARVKNSSNNNKRVVGLRFADKTPNLATRRRNLCQMPGDVARIKALVYFWRWLILTPAAAHRVHQTFMSLLLPCRRLSSRVVFAFCPPLLLLHFPCLAPLPGAAMTGVQGKAPVGWRLDGRATRKGAPLETFTSGSSGTGIYILVWQWRKYYNLVEGASFFPPHEPTGMR